LEKIEEAKRIIEKCRLEGGFHASTNQYPEFWMRDLVFSEDALLGLGYQDTIKRHFGEFLSRQRESGQLPTVVSTTWRQIYSQRFQFWVADGEILFLIGSRKYAQFTGDRDFLERNAAAIDRCLKFVEARLNQSGFVPGLDWRDAVPNYTGKCLLANQVLLLQMYECLREDEKASRLRSSINEVFFSSDHGFYADCVWWKGADLNREFRFDSFGNALAILHEVATKSRAKSVAEAFEGAKSQFGYRNIFPPLKIDRFLFASSLKNMDAFLRNQATFRNRPNYYQNSTIWPFVESRIVRTFAKLGLNDEADRAFKTMLNRVGFNEWYSPLTGEPRGSREQLWTAAAILEAKSALS
jgi:hypothetical protein